MSNERTSIFRAESPKFNDSKVAGGDKNPLMKIGDAIQARRDEKINEQANIRGKIIDAVIQNKFARHQANRVEKAKNNDYYRQEMGRDQDLNRDLTRAEVAKKEANSARRRETYAKNKAAQTPAAGTPAKPAASRAFAKKTPAAKPISPAATPRRRTSSSVSAAQHSTVATSQRTTMAPKTKTDVKGLFQPNSTIQRTVSTSSKPTVRKPR